MSNVNEKESTNKKPLTIEEKEQRLMEAIKDVLSKCNGLEYVPLKFQQYVKEKGVSYYLFASMKHVGLIDINKSGLSNRIRGKMDPKDVQPIHMQNVLKDIRKTEQRIKSQRKEVVTEVEKAVNGVKSELELLKEELLERNKYPHLDQAAIVAVKTLQNQGYVVSLKKELSLEFVREG